MRPAASDVADPASLFEVPIRLDFGKSKFGWSLRCCAPKSMWRAAGSLLAVSFLAAAVHAEPGFPADFVARLGQVAEIHVGTQRKDGSRSQVVPVWFAYVDGAIWFATKPSSIKARRVKRGSPMYVSASGAAGPFIETKAEIASDPVMAERLGQIYADKYWLAWIGYQRPSRKRLEAGEIILLRLTPVP